MKVSRFTFSNKEKNNRETYTTRSVRSRSFLEYTGNPDRSPCRWSVRRRQLLRPDFLPPVGIVIAVLQKTDRSRPGVVGGDRLRYIAKL